MTSKQIWVALALLGLFSIGWIAKPYKILNESGSSVVWRINETTGEICWFKIYSHQRVMDKICGGSEWEIGLTAAKPLKPRYADIPVAGEKAVPVHIPIEFEDIPIEGEQTVPVRFEDIPIEGTVKKGGPKNN